jgi:hypothetical protein
MAAEIPPTPIFSVNERFVVKVPFRNRTTGKKTITRILNAEGYIDYAHQIGLIKLETKIVKHWIEEKIVKVLVRDENNKPVVPEIYTDVIEKTRWCIAKATCVVFRQGVDKQKRPIFPEDCITATSFATANDRDQFVRQPGYEIQVAETRAKKRALADACNLTEKQISPDDSEPTREAVDMPLPNMEIGPASDGIPSDMKRVPDITPPLSHDVTHPGELPGGAGQFEI